MKKVLVVDDSKTIRTLCEWIFKGLEDRLFTADSADSARYIIHSEAPDVVVVDYTLPDVDSYDFVASISQHTHVVMMGGTYAAFSADKALASGAVRTIMKPFKTADFFAILDEAANASVAAPAPQHDTVAASAAVPPPAPRRFNFPGSSAENAAVASAAGTPPAAVSSVSQSGIAPVVRDSATPKTPVPSISPAVQAAATEQAVAQIDPAVIRAEVISAVKALLPVYLKKIIQAEVRPQLQNWVDSRVEALVNKYSGR